MVRRETYWSTITDCNGTVEQELSYDAWGNQRDPNTWLRNWYDPALEEPMFDRGFTGHEHLYAFGLINMNGRCYDPVMSSFLSVDAYVQSPDNSQNFNRYAYCLNNPLKYTDPSGWTVLGGSMGSHTTGAVEWGTNYAPVYEWRDICDPSVRSKVASAILTSYMVGNGCSISGFVSLSEGGTISGVDVIISPKEITPSHPYYGSFNEIQLNSPIDAKGKCVITALGSTNTYWFASMQKYGDKTKKWAKKINDYENKSGKEFNIKLLDIVEFIQWNDDKGSYSSYQAAAINVSQIKEALENDYAVGVCVYLNNQDDIERNSGIIGHFANISCYIPYQDGSVEIGFIEPEGTKFMKTYRAPNTDFIWMPKDYSTMNFIKYKLNP